MDWWIKPGRFRCACMPIAIAAILLACIPACERRIVRKEERPFMHYAEDNWKKLTPKQKADYYEMVERQKERARKTKPEE